MKIAETPAHGSAAQLMHSILVRIATGPEMSKDISEEEARAGMRFVLEGKIDPVQAGIFLIALRMKRESDEEYRGILAAIREASQTATAPVDELVDVAEPYDGFSRSLPAGPFLPALLAACGLPSVSHGLETVAPKFGLTHRQVLRAAGIDTDLAPERAAARLGDAAVGWAYIDQRTFCPALHDLIALRTLIVKRPTISTVESLVGPIRARSRTFIMRGFVHKAYPQVYDMLARASGFDSALIVRGTEGGVVPSLRQPTTLYYYRHGGESQRREVDPGALGVACDVRAVPLPETAVEAIDHPVLARAAVQAGVAALSGESGPMREALVYAAALCLWHAGRYDEPVAAADAVRRVLDSGAAAKRFAA